MLGGLMHAFLLLVLLAAWDCQCSLAFRSTMHSLYCWKGRIMFSTLQILLTHQVHEI